MPFAAAEIEPCSRTAAGRSTSALRIAAPAEGDVANEYESWTLRTRQVSRSRYAWRFIARFSHHDTAPASLACFHMDPFGGSFEKAWALLANVDPGLLEIVMRSLVVSATACALGFALGLAMGAWLGVARFGGRGAVLTVLNTFLALPSVVVGLVVYLLLSRSGPLGFLGWLFSVKAMVVAQTILVVPVAAALTRQVVEDVEAANGEQLRSLGAGPAVRALPIAWDERYALLTVAIACLGRAVSEAG